MSWLELAFAFAKFHAHRPSPEQLHCAACIENSQRLLLHWPCEMAGKGDPNTISQVEKGTETETKTFTYSQT